MRGMPNRPRSLSRSGTIQPGAAPGTLARLQALANTLDVERRRDELESVESFNRWVTDKGLLAPDTSLGEEAWKQALEVRAALRDQFRLHSRLAVKGRPAKRLADAFGKMRLFLTGDGSFRLQPAQSGWPGVMTRFAIAVNDAMRDRQLTRLKVCHADDCQWVFYDKSKSRSGKWCNGARCGNRVHTVKYRRREAREREARRQEARHRETMRRIMKKDVSDDRSK